MNICPYCRDAVGPQDASYMACSECGTPHHRECYDENAGCTLFGCKNAPPDEPKLQVTPMDMAFTQPGVSPYQIAAAPQPVTGFGDVNAGAPAFGGAYAAGTAAAPARVAPPPPPPRVAPPPLPGTMLAPAPERPAPVGYVTPGGIFSTPNQTSVAVPGSEPKSRVAFILLGLFFGAFGVHNFYAGFHKRGAMQLVITLVTFFYGSVVSWVWAIAEICTVKRDADDVHFA
jgi:hypothetical protein